MSSFNEITASIAGSLRESSPVIGLVVGVGALISAGVVACIATRKSEEILDEHQEEIKKIKKAKEEGKIDEKTASRQVGKTYLKTTGKVAVKMLPAVGLAVLGTAAIGGGYKIEHARLLDTKEKLAITSSTLAATVADFKAYRGRARERFGPEVDNELMYDIRKEQVEETILDEKGKEKKVVHEVTTVGDVGSRGCGIYARWFNKDCDAWVNDNYSNRYFLEEIERKLNQRLNTEGSLCVNQVYEEIGLKDPDFPDQPLKTKPGQIMGWINDPEKIHQITIGLGEPVNQDFINGKTPDCLICLEPEGCVWELFGE